MVAAVSAERSTAVHLIQVSHSGGTLRLATAPQDLPWNGFTWDAVGGLLELGAAEESPDGESQSMELTLSGVDTAVMSALLANQVRGFAASVWLAHVTEATGAIVADPLLLWTGYQNEAWEIGEEPGGDGAPGTCTVRTRVVSRSARLAHPQPVRANVTSHNELLARAGQAAGDTFFQNVPTIEGKPIYWGTNAPSGPSRGGQTPGTPSDTGLRPST
jgi:hypothetical protein